MLAGNITSNVYLQKSEFFLIYSGLLIAILSLGWVYFQSAKIFFQRNRATPAFIIFSILFIIPVFECEGIFLFSVYNYPIKFNFSEFLILLLPLLFFSGFLICTLLYYFLTSDIEWRR